MVGENEKTLPEKLRDNGYWNNTLVSEGGVSAADEVFSEMADKCRAERRGAIVASNSDARMYYQRGVSLDLIFDEVRKMLLVKYGGLHVVYHLMEFFTNEGVGRFAERIKELARDLAEMDDHFLDSVVGAPESSTSYDWKKFGILAGDYAKMWLSRRVAHSGGEQIFDRLCKGLPKCVSQEQYIATLSARDLVAEWMVFSCGVYTGSPDVPAKKVFEEYGYPNPTSSCGLDGPQDLVDLYRLYAVLLAAELERFVSRCKECQFPPSYEHEIFSFLEAKR